MSLDFQLEFLPAKGDRLPALFRLADADSDAQKAVKRAIRWLAQSYEATTNLLMANNE